MDLAFELAFKYRNPALILSDGVIGQMMERVVLPPFKARRTEEQIRKECPWATLGHKAKDRNIITSLELRSEVMEVNNQRFQEKYKKIEENEVRYEEYKCEDAEYVIVAYGSASRICQKTVDLAREQGIKLGLFRPITVWPFPSKRIAELADQVKGFISAELSAGQMVEDVRLAVNGKVPVTFYGRLDNMIFSPSEVLDAFKKDFNL